MTPVDKPEPSFPSPADFPDPPQWSGSPTLRGAIADMANLDFCRSPKYSEQQLRADYTGAHPVILAHSRLLVKRLRVLNIPVFPHCVWRNEETQTKAFITGNSKVRYPNSAHNHGCAYDLIHGYKAWGLSKAQWSVIGHIGLELAHMNGWQLTWGGDDPGINDTFDWDPAHWEITNWRNHKQTR